MTATGEVTASTRPDGGVSDPALGDEPDRVPGDGGSRGSHGWRSLLFGAGTYLLLSIIVWSDVWRHPATTTTCGCGDTSLFTWFLEWPAYAIAHGLNPLHSTAMHYPSGVNLLANTSVVAIGLLLAPVTWLFGPIASLNVALTLAPALSAVSMYVLLRRWVAWYPAAFVGGLLYGFSPFVLVTLTDAHLMLGMAVVPPLVVACLDELLFRQRRKPVPTGVVLGLLLTVQFFIGTEVLVITVLMGVVGVVLIVAYSAWRRPSELRAHAGYAATGLSAGAAVALLLLVIPAWYALSGPSHFGSSVWPGLIGRIARKQRTVPNYFFFRWSPLNSAVATAHDRIVGGYQGPVLSYQYFGTWMAVVVVGGTAAWWRDRRLWLFGAIAAVSAVLSLGSRAGEWLPWKSLQNLPILENVVPYRFVLITYLAVAVMLALIVEHVYVAVNRWRASAKEAATEAAGPTGPSRRAASIPPWGGAMAATAVAVIALVQPATYLAQSIPVTAGPAHLPAWFKTVAPSLPDHQVLLVLPAPFTSFDNPMTWQAVDHMRFSMVGEGGPGGILLQAGKETDGATVLAALSAPNAVPPPLTASAVTHVRQALDAWGVTMVVVPDQTDLPTYDQISSVTVAAALITAATGQRPVHQSRAWVWTDIGHTGAVHADKARLTRCTAGVADRGASAVRHATNCVLATPR